MADLNRGGPQIFHYILCLTFMKRNLELIFSDMIASLTYLKGAHKN